MRLERTFITILRSLERSLEEESQKTLKHCLFAYQCGATGLGADSFQGGVFGAEQSGDKAIESGSSADFVVDVRGRRTYFSVGRELAREAFAKHEKFDGLAHGDFAVIERYRFFAPRQIEFGFDTFERDFVVQLQKAFFIQLDAVAVVTDEKFVKLFSGCACHGLQELKQAKMRFLIFEHAASKFRAAGEAVRKIKRFGNHDARFAVGPVGWSVSLVRHAKPEFESGEVCRSSAVIVGVADSQNLPRQNACFRNGTRVSAARFRFEDGKDDGVAFDK